MQSEKHLRRHPPGQSQGGTWAPPDAGNKTAKLYFVLKIARFAPGIISPKVHIFLAGRNIVHIRGEVIRECMRAPILVVGSSAPTDNFILCTYFCLPTFAKDERRTAEISNVEKAPKKAFGTDICCPGRGIIV